MAVGPLTSDQIDTATLLNVPAPLAPNTLMGGLSTSQVPGSQIGYVPGFQSGSPYSATNLPEFMKGYEQTPSGRFAMSQGLLGMAPDVANIQSLFSKDYGQEYAPLEQKFQESFAFDPSMFGNMYRAGGFIPAQIPGFEVQKDKFNPAQAIAGAGALAAVYPYAEDLFNLVTDPFSGEVKKKEESLGEKFEEKVTQPAKKTFVDPLVKGWQESELKADIDKAYTAQKQFVRDEGLRTMENKTKEFLAKLDEKFDKPQWLNTFQETVLPSGKKAFDAYGSIENFANNPNPDNLYKAVDAVGELNTILPQDLQISLPGEIVGGVADASAGLAIGKALEDPTAANIAQAYGGLDHLVMNKVPGTLSKGLPGAGQMANVGTILGGLKAAEGGIDSAGEAVAVANAATTAALMATKGAAAGSTAASIGSIAGTVAPVLGPIGIGIGLEQILSEDLSVKDVLQGLPIVGRAFGGGGSTFGRAELGYKGDDFAFVDEASKNKGWVYTMPELHTTNLVLNELTDNLGFKVDQSKLKGIDQTIDINNGNVNRGANDIVIDMIEKGALIPTESTPNNIDWGGLFSDAREYSKGRHNEQTLPFTTVSQIREAEKKKLENAIKNDPFHQALSESLGNLDFSNLKIDQAAIAEGLKKLDFSKMAKPELLGVDKTGNTVTNTQPKPAPVVIPNLNIQPIDLSNLKLPDFSSLGGIRIRR
jgi:hypothetical protein